MPKATVKMTAKPAPKAAKKVSKADEWFEKFQKGLAVSQKAYMERLEESQKAYNDIKTILADIGKAHQETEKALGRMSNKMGDMAEYTLLPDLAEKFKKFGFTFQVVNRNRKIADYEHDIHAEVDAFLENGSQAMAVEVKTTLRHDDVDYHIQRMEKICQYADWHNDKRQFFGALAATVIDDDTKRYALKQVFYTIEPSGEDVKIVKPVSEKVW
jgi:hypothetical protein